MPRPAVHHPRPTAHGSTRARSASRRLNLAAPTIPTLAATGDEARAVAALTEALTLVDPQGHVPVFADEGPPMGALFGRLIATRRTDQAVARGVPAAYLGRLVRAFERRAAADAGEEPGVPAVPSSVTTLSARELEVLQLLAAGKQNQEIAGELYVARNTVKKHVTHIFDKLGAANRTEATARARELGVLPCWTRHDHPGGPEPARTRRLQSGKGPAALRVLGSDEPVTTESLTQTMNADFFHMIT